MWFSKLPPNTITSFQGLSKLFINNFIGGQRQKHSLSNLLSIVQGENESLRSFISRFNSEALLVDEMEDKILLAAFYNGVSLDLFIHKLYDQEPQMMVELIHSTQSFMNTIDAIIAKKKKKGERLENGYVHHPDQGFCQKKAKVGKKRGYDGKKQDHTQDNTLTTLP